DCGAEKVVVGTVAADSPDVLRDIVSDLGAQRVVAAVDVRDGVVRVAGWERDARRSLADVLRAIGDAGVEEVLVTAIAPDGVMCGPSFALYRSLPRTMRIIASGGVAAVSDVVSLARIGNVGGCVIGKALLDGRVSLAEARARAATPNAI